MKTFFAIVLVCALSVAVMGAELYYPGKNGECDFRCADLDVPVCASNGICNYKFQTQCFMDYYNCNKGSEYKNFRLVDSKFCSKDYYPRCTLQELY